MATSYVAGATGWSLIIAPLLVIAVYQLCFSDDGRDSNVNRYWHSSRSPSGRLVVADDLQLFGAEYRTSRDVEVQDILPR